MKTITMMDLRKSPGEFAHLVSKHGESFLVTSQGRPVFKMVPVEDMTVVNPDGTFKGPKPLTFRQDLGGEYGGSIMDADAWAKDDWPHAIHARAHADGARTI